MRSAWHATKPCDVCAFRDMRGAGHDCPADGQEQQSVIAERGEGDKRGEQMEMRVRGITEREQVGVFEYEGQ